MKSSCITFCLFVLTLLVTLPTTTHAQKQIIEYRSNDGSRVKKSQADYVRTLKRTRPGDELWILEEHYMNKQLRRKGIVTDPAELRFEGTVEEYDDNGKLRELLQYREGKKSGYASYYYAN